jgi:hypothetical protein
MRLIETPRRKVDRPRRAGLFVPKAPSSPFPLLITATITPPADVPFLVRSDPLVRLEDYRLALRFYLAVPDSAVDRIVFVDNSASDLSALQQVVGEAAGAKDVELISYPGFDYPVEQGRSVGETLLIADALVRSRIMSALGADELFWKVTGRLLVRNVSRLVASTPQSCDLYADFRRYRRRWVDTRAFAVTPAAFRRLFLPRIDLLRQDLLPAGFLAPEERLFADLLAERRRERICPRLRVEPLIEGSSGFGENYRRPKRRIESSVRAVTRRLLPFLWI